jgi:SAM-dependent methyltransferase
MYRFRRSIMTIIPKKHHRLIERIYSRLQGVFYIGNRVTCPCCHGHFRKFLPFGSSQRPNAQCPRCGSLERHRSIWLYLKNNTALFSNNLKVLHIAPEPVFQEYFLSMANLNYVSADLESPLAMISMDIMNIPYEKASFDVILCSHVLEEVIDDKKAIRELYRVLKPGGWAILQSPVDLKRSQTFEDSSVISPEDRKRLFGETVNRRVYGQDYRDRLEEAGFRVSMEYYVRDLGRETIKKYGLTQDPIYVCLKNIKGEA